ADGRKDEVAWAKIYFAYTTERYELLAQTEEDAIRIEERQKLLLKNAELQMRVRMAGGITPRHFATFFNRGYQGLYNGETAEDIRIRNGLPSKTDILDWMGGVERAANGMRAALTLHHLTERDVKTPPEANETHDGVGTRVRAFLASESIYPEKLPTLRPLPAKMRRTLPAHLRILLRPRPEQICPGQLTSHPPTPSPPPPLAQPPACILARPQPARGGFCG
ncbi:MAG: hypothetical protein ACXWQZ_17745, partial [Ktedonobacterales bacterium]